MSDEKKIDGLKVLGDVTGLGREEMVKIHQEVKANHSALRACPGPHNFVAESDPPMRRVNRYRCTKCGGTVSINGFHWYSEGLKHGQQPTPDPWAVYNQGYHAWLGDRPHSTEMMRQYEAMTGIKPPKVPQSKGR